MPAVDPAALAQLEPDWVQRCQLVGVESDRSAPRPRMLIAHLRSLNRLSLPDVSYTTIRDSGTLLQFAHGVYTCLQLPCDATPFPPDHEDAVDTAKRNLGSLLDREPSRDRWNIYDDPVHEDLGYYCQKIFVGGAEYSSDVEPYEGDEGQVNHAHTVNSLGRMVRDHLARRAKHELYELYRFLEGSPEGRTQLQSFRNMLRQKDEDGRYPYLPLQTAEMSRFGIDLAIDLDSDSEDGGDEDA